LTKISTASAKRFGEIAKYTINGRVFDVVLAIWFFSIFGSSDRISNLIIFIISKKSFHLFSEKNFEEIELLQKDLNVFLN